MRAAGEMAERFRRGGVLFAFGNGLSATDAQHVAVEFVHPVLVGKPALPAMSLAGDVATLTSFSEGTAPHDAFSYQLRQLATARDIAMGISTGRHSGSVAKALGTASAMGMLTISLSGLAGGPTPPAEKTAPGERTPRGKSVPAGDPAGADDPAPVARHHIGVASDDPWAVKELHVTAYHLLWELVHVFLEQDALTGVPR